MKWFASTIVRCHIHSVNFVMCVSPHDGAESPYTTKAVVFTSSHQQHQFVLHSGALCLRLLTLAHSATPTLPPQMHSSTRSGSRTGVLLSNVLSRWMRLMWVLRLNHQSWGKTNSNAGGPLAPAALPWQETHLAPRWPWYLWSKLLGAAGSHYQQYSDLFHALLCCFCVNYSTGSPSAKQSAAQGTRSPAPKVHTGTFLSSGVKVSSKSLFFHLSTRILARLKKKKVSLYWSDPLSQWRQPVPVVAVSLTKQCDINSRPRCYLQQMWVPWQAI